MSKQKKQKSSKQSQPIPETALINQVSEVASQAVARLPNTSGDLLNFVADVVAGLALGYLWKVGNLPGSQVLMSFVVLLVFLLLCFAGALLMRLVESPEKPG